MAKKGNDPLKNVRQRVARKAGKGVAPAAASAHTTNTAAPATAAATATENNSGQPENSACIDAGTGLTLATHSDTTARGNNAPATQQETSTMDRKLTLNTGTRKGNVAVYQVEGNPASVRINKRLFAGNPPAELVLTGDGMLEAKQPKRKLTKEERAALPKPTAQELADRAATSASRAVARAQKLAAKAAAAPATK